MDALQQPPTMTYEQEKEEKLKLAREKLKQFRLRKKEVEGSVSSPQGVQEEEETLGSSSGVPEEPSSSSTPMHMEQQGLPSRITPLSSLGPRTPEITPHTPPNILPEVEEIRRHYEVYCQTLSNQVNSLQETLSSSSISHRDEMDRLRTSYEEKIRDLSGSIHICVSEKSELSIDLDKSRKELNGLKDEVMSLESRLQEALSSSAGQFEENKRLELKEEELKALQNDLTIANETVIIQGHEISEITSKLKAKSDLAEEFESLYVDIKFELEITELNLSQMRNGNPDELLAEKNGEIDKLSSESEAQEKRISELSLYIQQSNGERDQIINQYTSYSQQLVAQIEALNKTLSEKMEENSLLSESEKSLLSTVQSLEARLQELMNLQSQREAAMQQQQTAKYPEENVEDLNVRITELSTSTDILVEEKGRLVAQVDEQESRIQELSLALEEGGLKMSSMETEMEMLRSNFEAAPLNDNLVETMESDKVAASRAMSQNQDLKKQLEELQSALINLTNAKAGLMNELEDQKRRNVFLSKSADESEGIKAIFEEKNRTIKTLSDQLKRLLHQQEQEKLIRSREEGDSEGSERLKDENLSLLAKLEKAQDELRSLEASNSNLQTQLSSQQKAAPVIQREELAPPLANTPPSSISSDDASYVHVEIPDPSEDTPEEGVSKKSSQSCSEEKKGATEPEELDEEDMSLASSVSSLSSTNTTSSACNKGRAELITSVPNLEIDVAHFKLQQKFHEAMKKIADLMNEKDYLEHIVVQLQEETETVGEYITLYQYQRTMQKKNLDEKELQLQKVCRDREELLSKMDRLQKLLTHFVEKKEHTALPTENSDALLEASSGSLPAPTQPPQFTPTVPSSYQQEDPHQTSAQQEESKETATKILSLLSEIGNNSALKDEFRPWFWGAEAGQLITI